MLITDVYNKMSKYFDACILTVKVKVQQSLYSPEQALAVPEG
jgi:hypothetical protein